MDRLTIIQPDDAHLHLRTGSVLQTVIAHTAKQFARAIVMPNLKPAVLSVAEALLYQQEILAALPEGSHFKPLMTLYLTSNTPLSEVKKLAESESVIGFKLYPAGVTTHSDQGVAQIEDAYPLFAEMEKYHVPLLVHAEVAGNDYDIFDREKIFIDTSLTAIQRTFPALRIVVEHLTTQEAVDFVAASPANVAATITPQHLLFNRNAMLMGGIRPHFYCLPILKREQHRQALVAAATSGNTKYFLGTDSAPHLKHLKENHCGCAGCYTAPTAIALYAEAFAQANALDKLEAFASFNAADFYGLARNTATITLEQQTWTIPESYGTHGHEITPLLAGESLRWQVVCH